MSLFKAKLFKRVLRLSSLDYLNQAISIVSAALYIRVLGADLFGLFKYLQILLEVPNVFINQLNKTSLRFNVDFTQNKRIKLLQLNFAVKGLAYTVYLTGFLLFFVFIDQLETFNTPLARPSTMTSLLMLVTIWLLTLSQSVDETLSIYIVSLDKAEVSQASTLCSQLLSLILAISLFLSSITNPVQVLFSFILIRLSCILLVISYKVYWLSRSELSVSSLFQRIYISEIKETFAGTLKVYTLPLQLNILFGWLKDKFAVFILGGAGELEAVGQYEIVRSMFNFPRKFFPRLFELLLSKAVTSYKRSYENFLKKLWEVYILQFVFALFSGAVLISLSRLIFKAFNIAPTKELYLFMWVLSINLIFSAIANSNNYILEIKNRATTLFQASIFRTSVYLPIGYFLIKSHGPLGAATGLTTSTVILNLFLSYKTRIIERKTLFMNACSITLGIAVSIASIPLIEWFFDTTINWKDFF